VSRGGVWARPVRVGDAALLRRRHWPAALLLLAQGAHALAANNSLVSTPQVPPVDVSRLPAPGSYQLRRLMRAHDGEVLTSSGRSTRLHTLLRERLTVLSFMYTYCRDPIGCPRAWQAMERVHSELQRDATLARRAQLISLSFDPTNDTPEQMRLYGGERLSNTAVRWQFLTTASVPALLPTLRAFGQDVSIETDTKGRATRTLNHMLKLFLIDEALQVREIYSVATLEPQAIINDLRTLQLESARAWR
jgi:protein SCO1